MIDLRRRRWKWAGPCKEKLQSSCQDTISFFRVHTLQASGSSQGVIQSPWKRQPSKVSWLVDGSTHFSWRFSCKNMGVVRGWPHLFSKMLEITQIFVANSFVPETILGGENIKVNTTGKNIALITIIFMWREQIRNRWIPRNTSDTENWRGTGSLILSRQSGKTYWEYNIREIGKERKLYMGRAGNCFFKGNSQWHGPTLEIQLLTML